MIKFPGMVSSFCRFMLSVDKNSTHLKFCTIDSFLPSALHFNSVFLKYFLQYFWGVIKLRKSSIFIYLFEQWCWTVMQPEHGVVCSDCKCGGFPQSGEDGVIVHPNPGSIMVCCMARDGRLRVSKSAFLICPAWVTKMRRQSPLSLVFLRREDWSLL